MPSWLTASVPAGSDLKLDEMRQLLSNRRLNSVCQSARCPNIAHCFSRGTVTFMILGDVCTRNCLFCGVAKGIPGKPDADEPSHVAETVSLLKLRHVVITSVTRDDLCDGGAAHFSNVADEVRTRNPHTAIELLIPDFQGSLDSMQTIVNSQPDIVGHNIETVPRIFKKLRKEASFERSLDMLAAAKNGKSSILTKSGFMVGLGEKEGEVIDLLSALRDVRCDIVTIGQYLRPSSSRTPVVEYIKPSVFECYREMAVSMGFKAALSGPLVRSSFNALELLDNIDEGFRGGLERNTEKCNQAILNVAVESD
ncbi:MAG: lipoyl synthase [Deltaproteobacteria bacterium]|nr:lipoyl synthase [Deltaproteobacteria bacterium]